MRALPPIREEFVACDFPDLRLLDRVVRVATQLDRDPQLSLPEAFRDPSQLEGTYRFFSNSRVDLATVIGGHIENTVRRAAEAGKCLAIHDTTGFSFEGEREGLGRVDRAQQGFYAHACLCVAANGTREPLGLLALDPWIRGKKKGKRTTEKRRKEGRLESERWLEQSLAVEAIVSRDTKLIHVEDREGDIFESLAVRVAEKMHFIVRAASTRVVITTEGAKQNVLEYARNLPLIGERQAELSARKNAFAHRPKAQHRNRKARTALLELRAGTIRVRCPSRGGSVAELEINAVHVRETNQAESEVPVEWLLFTTEPISSMAKIVEVVDNYRARWLIEEYFKALKTGCKYEERQLESVEALLNALGVFAILAWRLLLLRFIQREAGDAPASTVASREEIAVLVAQKRLKANATAAEFLAALARYGGHLSQNGPPGLLILWRALRALQPLAEGWRMAKKM